MDRPLTRELTRRLSGPYSYIYNGALVEVTSNLEGYVGSWYEAKVFTLPKLPKSKFKSRREMHVEYTHLLSEKSKLPLKERVDVVLVRPLPPRIVPAEDEAEGDFEVRDEVDTLDRDGWWSGVVDRVIRRVEEGKEEDRYIVRFDDPVHEIEFRRDELRLHLDWMNGKWFVCRDGRSQELSVTSDGCVTLASIRCILKDLKHPINHDRQVVMGFCAKRCLRMVVPSNGRLSTWNKKPSPCLSTSFHEEMIDLEYPCCSSSPAKNIKRTSMDYPSVLASGISDESTSEPCDAAPRLLDDGVKPLGDCQNKVAGSYITGAFNRKHITSSHAKRMKRKRSKHWRTILARGKAKKAAGVNNRPSMDEDLFIGTKLTHKGKQGEVQNAKDVHSCTSMEKRSPVAVGTDLTYKVQGVHKNPSLAEQSCVAIGTAFSHKKQENSLVENDGMSSGREGADMLSKEEPARNDVVEGIPFMPFAKISPVWQAVESLEVFQRFPQRPHFLPLMGEKEGVREGLAIAKMVTFATVGENVLKLSIDDPINRFTDCLEILHSLKLSGFTTKAIENRVIKLLSLKEEQQKMEEKKSEVQNQVSELIRENDGHAKGIHEIVNKLKAYQEQLAAALLKKEERDSALLILRTSLEMMDTVMHRTQLDFKELNQPW